MADDPADLELDAAEMTRLGRAVLDRCVAHVASLGRQPASGDVVADELCRSLRGPAPRQGELIESLLDRLFDDYVPRSFTTAGPGYMAYVPGGGLYSAALADLIADTTNRYVGVWQAAPVLAQIEAQALDWLRDWMALPPTTRGLFTSGGSMSSFSAIVTAREAKLGARLRDGVAYVSRECHHSLVKAARLAGILDDRVRRIGVDQALRLRVEELAPAIAADRARGLVPFLVVSSAGTVNTGAVDPLDEIAALCQREGLWHHCDAAYGGFFHAVPALRGLLAGLPRADSIALDPHKGLFLPYGTGALLVRDGALLRRAHAASAGYLPQVPDDEFYDMSSYGPELSRPFRGLRVWLTVRLFGTERLLAAIAEKRALAVRAHEALRQVPELSIVAPPMLSLFAFWVRRPGGLEAENAATRALVERVTSRGKVMLSGSWLESTAERRFVARICVLSFRTRAAQVETCIEHVREAARALAAGQ